MTACPTEGRLRQFLADELPEREDVSLARHVDFCPRCQDQLERLAKDTDLESWLSAGSDCDSPFDAPGEGLPEGLLDRLKALMPACRGERLNGSDGRTSHAALPEPLGPSQRSEKGTDAGGAQAEIPVARQLGHYQLLREIGGGGMGRVYEAVHTRLKRRVAVKMLSPHRLSDEATVRRFYHEMEAVGALDHPHIVQATDAGEAGGIPYLVMEFVDGRSLAEVLAERGRLSVRETCLLLRQAALGLEHAHRHGLVHRDIKPSNLLWTQEGQIKICDLGLARLRRDALSADELTTSRTLLGTVHYMAPEQADGMKNADHRADLYSLGCTAFHLLAGRTVYQGPGPPAVLLAHQRQPVPSLRELRPEVPVELDRLIRRSLAKNPDDRVGSMTEFLRELAPLLDDCEQSDALLLPVELENTIGSNGQARAPAATTARIPVDAAETSRDERYGSTDWELGRKTPGRGGVRRRLRRAGFAVAALVLSGLMAAYFAGPFRTKTASQGVSPETAPGAEPPPRDDHPRPRILPARSTGPVRDLGWVPGSDRLFCVAGREVQFWNVETKEQTGAVAADGAPISTAGLSPRGDHLLVGQDDGTLRLVDVKSGRELQTWNGHAAGVTSVAFLPDGRRAVSGSWDGTARLWDLERAEAIQHYRVNATGVYSVAVAPDGGRALFGGRDNTAGLWDLANGELLERREYSEKVLSVAFSPDGSRALLGLWDGTVRIWDLRTGAEPLKLSGHFVNAVAFGPAGHRVIYGDRTGAIRIWDLEAQRQVAEWQDVAQVEFLAVSPDGRFVATSTGKISGRGPGTVRVFSCPDPPGNELPDG